MEAGVDLLAFCALAFFVMAVSIEAVLEVITGALKGFGFRHVSGKYSAHEIVALTTEFAPDELQLRTRIAALETAAGQVTNKFAQKIAILEESVDKLEKVITSNDAEIHDELKKLIPQRVNELAIEIEQQIEASEAARVWFLKIVAASIGLTLAIAADFNIFALLADAKALNAVFENPQKIIEGLKGIPNWIGYCVSALGGAAGSSYWHDLLDKARNAKTALASVRKLSA